MSIADSRAQFGGGPACPGLGSQGSIPIFFIASAPSQTNPVQLGASCQLSFCAITVCPEYSRSNGLAKVPGTKNGDPDIEGPRDRIKTCIGVDPAIINPPIMALSPVSTRLRVEMLPSLAS